MNKIIRMGATFRKVFGFLTFIPLSSAIFLGISATQEHSPLLSQLLGVSNIPIPPSVQVMNKMEISLGHFGFYLFLPLLVVQSYWLWQLKRLFEMYAQGKIFIAQNTIYIRRAAIAFLGITILSMGINMLLSVFLTINNLIEYRLLLITIGILQICNILMGIVLFVIAWIMDEGRRLQEENDSTI